MSLMNRLRPLLAAVALALPVIASGQPADRPFSNEQLDQMLAQIALYPDSLLSQLLMASTYPDEFEQAVAWSKSNQDAKGDDAVKMVETKDWDPSVASLVAFPEVLVTLGEKPEYVKNLGDAFLAQPDDVMTSVQRLRAAAHKAGNLKSNEQIKVSTDASSPAQAAPARSSTTIVQPPPVTQTIIIEPAQPSVVYVPAYNPTEVYGPWWYPSYPPYYYPPVPGYWWSRPVAAGIAWGVGIGVRNALWGGVNWGRGDVNININRYNNINVNRRIDADGNRANWSHDSSHRRASYRGGDATRQKLEQKRASTSREQYRGKDLNRDASRERAQQRMQQRGIDPGSGSARDRAQNVDRSQVRQRAQNMERDAARDRAQSGDRVAARQRAESSSRDNALRGANSGRARAEQSRGAASVQRASYGGRAGQAQAVSGGGGARGGSGRAVGGRGGGRAR